MLARGRQLSAFCLIEVELAAEAGNEFYARVKTFRSRAMSKKLRAES
jgi:hypothetical protein